MREERQLELIRGGVPGDTGARTSRPAAGAELARIWVAAMLALAAICSLALDGFYSITAWGPVGLALFCACVLLVLTSGFTFSRAGWLVVGGLAVLTGWAAVSSVWAPGVDRAWTEANRTAVVLAAAVAAAAALRSPRAARVSHAVILAGAAGTVLYLAASFAVGANADWFVSLRLNEPTGYINGATTFFLIAFWVFVGAAERARSYWLAAAAVALAAASLDLLVMTESRVLLIALPLSAAAAFALAPGRVRRAWLVIVAAGPAALALPWVLDVYEADPVLHVLPPHSVLAGAGRATVVAAVAAALLWATLARLAGGRVLTGRTAHIALIGVAGVLAIAGAAAAWNPVTRLHHALRDFTTLQHTQVSGASRFTFAGGYRYDLWRVAWKQFRQQPLRGVGAGNYDATYYRERSSPEYVRQPHSIELQALAELGIPGGLALLAVLGGVSSALVGARRRPELIAVVPTAAGAATGWLVGASVDWIHLLPGLTLILFVLLGPLLAGEPRRASPRVSRGYQLATMAVLVVAAIASASLARQLAGKVYVNDARHELPVAPQAATASARKAIAHNKYDPEAWYVLAAAYARRNDYVRARDALLAAAHMEPFNYVPWTLLGDLATRRGLRGEARRAYARAAQLNPHDAALIRR